MGCSVENGALAYDADMVHWSRNDVDFHRKNLETLLILAHRAEQAVANAARRNNALRPIHTLPDELLLHIFTTVLALPDLTLPEDEKELQIRCVTLSYNRPTGSDL